jgi:metal-responsive CopG/Arc/MetJ family transcriptional regulator
MKTAISIPDEVFNKAEELAKSLGISRSELYTQAVTHFIKCNRSKTLTEALNEVYSHEDSTLDEGVAAMQFSSIGLEEW